MTFCYFSCLGRYYFGPHLWQFSAHWPSLADLKGCLIWLNLLNEWVIKGVSSDPHDFNTGAKGSSTQ